MANVRHIPNCARACAYCRQRKVKCDGETPCANCVLKSEACFYPPPRRGKGNHKKQRVQTSVKERLARIENLLQSSSHSQPPSFAGTQPEASNQVDQSFSSDLPLIENNYPSRSETAQNFSSNLLITPDLNSHPEDVSSNQVAATKSASPQHSVPIYSPDSWSRNLRAPSAAYSFQGISVHGQDKVESVSHEAEYNVPTKTRVWEYHGPGSWLSICSEPGVAWITERTGSADFAKSAQRLTTAWNRCWRLGYPSTRSRNDEPDIETAWKYTSAFFDHCFEAVFGIVHRPDFEARLRAHFEQDSIDVAEDIAWYALRNTIYAAGCRQLLLKGGSITYAEAQANTFRYFDRAFQVHTELIYGPPTLDAVRALTAMMFYAHGTGNQYFEYMMCANTVCLAQAKGLHRRPSKALQLSPVEAMHRNWLFWAIYCGEKKVAFRSGRPSFIDDANISCEIPDRAPPGSTINVTFFKHAIKISQFTAQIDRRLASVTALRQDPSEFIQAVNGLREQIETWRKSIDDVYGVGQPIKPEQLPPNVRPLHVMYLHYAYYAGIQAVFMVFTCPWLSAILNIDNDPSFRQQVASKANQVAEAARGIILLFKSMVLDAGLPHWATFYFPMSALASLFVFVLNSPTSPTAQADIALLDIAAGHFSHMEYLTALELGAPFSREAARLARETVDKAKNKAVSRPISSVSPQDLDLDSSTVMIPQLESFHADQFDYEGWNMYSMEVTSAWLGGSDLLDFTRYSPQ